MSGVVNGPVGEVLGVRKAAVLQDYHLGICQNIQYAYGCRAWLYTARRQNRNCSSKAPLDTAGAEQR